MKNTTCTNCNSQETIKYGHNKSGNQRLLCNHCHSTFCIEPKKKTYSPEYISKVIHQYNHLNKKAKDVIEEFKISSRTLLKRSKKDTGKNCPFC